MSLTTFSILLYVTIGVGWIGFLWIVGALIKEGLGAWRGRNGTPRATAPRATAGGSTGKGASDGSAS